MVLWYTILSITSSIFLVPCHLIYTLLDSNQYGFTFQSFCGSIVDAIPVSMVVEMTIYFLTLFNAAKSLNRSFSYFGNCPVSKATVSGLKKMLNIHDDLNRISRKGNEIFGFVFISGIMVCYVNLSLSALTFWIYNERIVPLIIITILDMAQLIPLTIVIFICSAVINEVSFISYIS